MNKTRRASIAMTNDDLCSLKKPQTSNENKYAVDISENKQSNQTISINNNTIGEIAYCPLR